MWKIMLLFGMFVTKAWALDLTPSEAVPGEFLVKFKQDKNNFNHKSYHLAWLRDLPISYGKFAVYQGPEKNISSLLVQLRQDPNVEYAEPNFIYHLIRPHRLQLIQKFFNPSVAQETMDDPFLSQQWALASKEEVKGGADVFRAWENFTNIEQRPKIAIIDTGIDYRHPDLAANIWSNTLEAQGLPEVDDDNNGYVDDVHGYNFEHQNAIPLDDYGHGTHCAGVIGAIHHNQQGIRGILGNVDLVAIKFMGVTGGTLENAILAIDYATQIKVDIMSNSWGGAYYSQALEEAIARAAAANIWFVVAAGNEYSNLDQGSQYPASYQLENMLVVTAHGQQGYLAPFANYGKRSVDLSAPGVEIFSTVPGNNYESMSGTSMSTPVVAGALGLLLAQQSTVDRDFAIIKERFAATSTKVRSLSKKVKMGGMLNVYQLLANIQAPVPPVPGEDLWQQVLLDSPLESEHPYLNRWQHRRVITIPNAQYMRVKVDRYQLEANYDYLIFSHPVEGEVDRLSGTGENYISEYIQGDTIIVDFKTDINGVDWGFLINSVEIIEQESSTEDARSQILTI